MVAAKKQANQAAKAEAAAKVKEAKLDEQAKELAENKGFVEAEVIKEKGEE